MKFVDSIYRSRFVLTHLICFIFSTRITATSLSLIIAIDFVSVLTFPSSKNNRIMDTIVDLNCNLYPMRQHGALFRGSSYHVRVQDLVQASL